MAQKIQNTGLTLNLAMRPPEFWISLILALPLSKSSMPKMVAVVLIGRNTRTRTEMPRMVRLSCCIIVLTR